MTNPIIDDAFDKGYNQGKKDTVDLLRSFKKKIFMFVIPTAFIFLFSIATIVVMAMNIHALETQLTSIPEPKPIEEQPIIVEPVITINVTQPTVEVDEWESLGYFKLTAYCSCERCCGGGADAKTATGTTVKANHTIAVDPKVIPYGTIVMINGEDYVAEDCGGKVKGKVIDIYFDDHDDAVNFGVQYAEVFIKRR